MRSGEAKSNVAVAPQVGVSWPSAGEALAASASSTPRSSSFASRSTVAWPRAACGPAIARDADPRSGDESFTTVCSTAEAACSKAAQSAVARAIAASMASALAIVSSGIGWLSTAVSLDAPGGTGGEPLICISDACAGEDGATGGCHAVTSSASSSLSSQSTCDLSGEPRPRLRGETATAHRCSQRCASRLCSSCARSGLGSVKASVRCHTHPPERRTVTTLASCSTAPTSPKSHVCRGLEVRGSSSWIRPSEARSRHSELPFHNLALTSSVKFSGDVAAVSAAADASATVELKVVCMAREEGTGEADADSEVMRAVGKAGSTGAGEVPEPTAEVASNAAAGGSAWLCAG